MKLFTKIIMKLPPLKHYLWSLLGCVVAPSALALNIQTYALLELDVTWSPYMFTHTLITDVVNCIPVGNCKQHCYVTIRVIADYLNFQVRLILKKTVFLKKPEKPARLSRFTRGTGFFKTNPGFANPGDRPSWCNEAWVHDVQWNLGKPDGPQTNAIVRFSQWFLTKKYCIRDQKNRPVLTRFRFCQCPVFSGSTVYKM